MVKRCINGHYYAGDRFEQCPYCGAMDANANNASDSSDATIPVGFSRPAQAQPVQQPVPMPQSAPMAFADDDDDATIPLALYNKMKTGGNNVSEPAGSGVMAPAGNTPAAPVGDPTIKTDVAAEFMPEQKPEAAPVVTKDIADLVAEAIAEDKPSEPDVTEQPSAEEIAAADAAMQQEAQAAETSADTAMQQEAQAAEIPADAAIQQEPQAAEMSADAAIQQAVQPAAAEDTGVTEQLAAETPADMVMQPEQQFIQTEPVQQMPVQPMPMQAPPMPPMPPMPPQPVYGQPAAGQYQQPYQTAYNGGYAYQQPMAPMQETYSAPAAPQPVTGWLVGLNGPVRGKVFELKAGRNFIGRAPDSEIVLAEDNAVSYSRHASVIYEPNTRKFIAQAGESNGLIYLNGEMVLNSAQLTVYDRITVGSTRLLFFPLCSESFDWEDLEKSED